VHDQVRTLAALEGVLASCWDENTCDPADDWDPANPAIGHCGVTAMAVLELLGGELLEAEVRQANGERNGVHYWNRLHSGLEVDLTRQQFRQGERLTEPVVRVLNWKPNARMASRYNLFAARVRQRLGTDVPVGCPVE
jgi:hypothetical protein